MSFHTSVLVPCVKKTYENMELLFNLTKFDNVHFKFVLDFKLLLIINGQQTEISMYPFPFCFITAIDLKNRIDLKTDKPELNNNKVNDLLLPILC